MVQRCANFGQKALAISDHGNLCSIPALFKECKSAGLKAIAGIELYISDAHSTIKDPSNRKLNHLVLLAKNFEGWKTLLKIHAKSFSEESYYYRPRISLEEIGELNSGQNLIAISGHAGSSVAAACFRDHTAAYAATSYEEARNATYLEDWEPILTQSVHAHFNVFGKDNVFLEIQGMDQERLIMSQVLIKMLRAYAKKHKLRTVATYDSHYLKKEDAILQRVFLCDKFKTNLASVRTKLLQGDNVALGSFFQSSQYYMLSPQEMEQWHTEEELTTSGEIADMIEEYDIFKKQECPPFPDCDNAEITLREICYNKLDQYLSGNPSLNEAIYRDRLNYEFSLIGPHKLSDYFLVIRDIIQYARGKGQQISTRGSVGGSLISFLSEISRDLDPIRDELLFERFINPDRIGLGLADIDVDCMRSKRGELINYVKNKYGEDRVAQCMTFSMLKGKSALRSVMRAHNVPFQMQLDISQGVLDEAKVADDLQDYEEETGEKSLIKLSLTNNAKELDRYAQLLDDGRIVGDYAEIFEQAARLEYTRHHLSSHAGAVIIGMNPLSESVPMMRGSKGEDLLVAVEFPEAEEMGLMKADILGLNTLDRVDTTLELVNNGKQNSTYSGAN